MKGQKSMLEIYILNIQVLSKAEEKSDKNEKNQQETKQNENKEASIKQNENTK